MLFCDIQLCIINVGHSSPWFTPTQGLFQGNPLGPFRYTVLIETLAM